MERNRLNAGERNKLNAGERYKMSSFEKIAYIVPSETLKESVSGILAEEISEGILDVLMTDVENAAGEYRRLCDEGYACIVARGGTYKDLKVHADIVPVIEERIHISDILEMLADEGIRAGHTCYVILHKETAGGAENFVRISEGLVHVLRYGDLGELRELIMSIPEKNVKVLSSAYAASVSDRDDLEFIELKNRPHTIKSTVRNARTFLGQMQENIQHVNTINSIYNHIDEGIIMFDAGHTIIEGNDRAFSFLGRARHEVIGKKVNELVPAMPSPRKDGTCSVDSPRTFTGRLGKYQISFTVYPFEFYRDEKRLIMILQDVTKIQTLERNIRVQLAKKGMVADHHFEDILTEDPGMEHVIGKAKAVAGFEGSVLIYGESGTGKELFAQSIHNESGRSSGPFVAINCAALTESLLESELFGYVGGAFTGARKEGKAGLFELAHNGTIFLDEINSTPLSLQAKILRVIESQQVMRVGSDYVIPLNVRVISASNGNLDKDIEEGSFRRDLYYRLNTFELTVPPVRERKADILMLFRYYAAKASGKTASEIQPEPGFEAQLLEHSWMGNVREIRSVALRYHAFAGDNTAGDILKPSAVIEKGSAKEDKQPESGIKERPVSGSGTDASPDISADIGPDEMIPLSELSAAVDRLVIESLEKKGLSRTDIARALGISRQGLYKKINKKENAKDR